MFLFGRRDDGSEISEYFVTIIGCLINFVCGVHVGWTSPHIKKLQSPEYPFGFSSESVSLIVICGPIGDILGEISSALLVDRIGRRNSLLTCSIPILMSFILIYFSYMFPSLLFVARVLGGVTMGSTMTLTPMYVGEIARPAIRAKLGVLAAFSFIFGLICITYVGNYVDIRTSSLIFMAIILIYLSTFSSMPETPYFHLMTGDLEGAEKALKFLRRKENVKTEVHSLTADVARQQSESGRYRDLFLVKSTRKAMVLMIMCRIFQQMTGVTAFTMYAQELLSTSREFVEPHFALMLIYLLQTCSVLLCGTLSDKFGRVPLMTLSMFSCSVILCLQGVFFTLEDFYGVDLPDATPAILLGCLYFMFQLGMGSLLTVLAGELFPTSVKSKAICVTNITYSVTVIVSTKFYQISADYIHVSVCFYFFAAFSLAGAIFVEVFLPETRGKTLEEIQMDLKGIIRRKSKISITVKN